jgi:hypothetical protein
MPLDDFSSLYFSLRAELASVTRISGGILIGNQDIEKSSIANRMGWATHRTPTRPEDMAYRLMGIYSVDMPFMYSEDAKAFIRLQEEIKKSSVNNQSLFVWTGDETPENKEYGLRGSP